MLVIKPYYSESYDLLLPLLKDFAPHISDEKWAYILEYKWENKLGYRGMLLENDGLIVGFLSYVLNQKEIEGKEITFCNISSWVVNPEFRSKSLQLLSPLFKIKNIIILNLSPHENTLSVFNALRFDKLSEFEYLVNPFKLKFYLLKKERKTSVKIKTISSQNIDSTNLTSNTKQAIVDHLPFKNVHFYDIELTDDGVKKNLTIALNQKKMVIDGWKNNLKELPYKLFNKNIQSEMMFCSSSQLLSNFFIEILEALFSITNSRIINVSEHFVNKIDLNLNYIVKSKKDRPMFLYTDTDLKHCDLNFLYSEKVLLNF